MNSSILNALRREVLYQTKRLTIRNWISLERDVDSKMDLLKNVLRIMSPKVTQDLPDGWQNISNIKKAEEWAVERKNDSNFYAIQVSERFEIIGFLFLYTEDESEAPTDLRLGYLLDESYWGKGLGSELIGGLVSWCKKELSLKSISGGVERNNIASIRVLEKNGFLKTDEVLPGNMLLYRQELT